MISAPQPPHLTNLLAEAVELVKEGNLDSAIAILRDILGQDSNHELALGILASIYLQIGMNVQAIDLYNALLAVNPENTLARFQLGMAQFTLGQSTMALKTWEAMLTLPNEFMAHFHSALALIDLGNHQQALELLIQAGANMPQSHPLYPRLLDLHSQLAEQRTTEQ